MRRPPRSRFYRYSITKPPGNQYNWHGRMIKRSTTPPHHWEFELGGLKFSTDKYRTLDQACQAIEQFNKLSDHLRKMAKRAHLTLVK